MMRLATSVLITLLLAASLGAQWRPDLSGTWALDAAKTRAARSAAPRGGGSSGAGGTMSGRGAGPFLVRIQQTRDTLIIDRVLGDDRVRTVYKLDNSESVNVDGNRTTRMRARWDGAKLVVEGVQVATVDGSERTIQLSETYSADRDGSLRIETTRSLPAGARKSIAIYARQRRQ